MSEKCAYLVESGESRYCRLAEANIQKVVQRAESDAQVFAQNLKAAYQATLNARDRADKAESVVEAAKTLIRYLQHAPEAIGVLQSDDTALDSLIEAVEEWEAQHGKSE